VEWHKAVFSDVWPPHFWVEARTRNGSTRAVLVDHDGELRGPSFVDAHAKPTTIVDDDLGGRFSFGELQATSKEPLFVVFSDVKPTLDGVRLWADRFGPLVYNRSMILDEWQSEIESMRWHVDLYRQACAARGDARERRVKRAREWLARHVVDGERGKWLRSYPDEPDRVPCFDRHFMHTEIERMADERDPLTVSMAFDALRSTLREKLDGTTLSVTGDRDRFELSYSPLTLLGALWLSFADVVTRGEALRPCEVCSTMMRIGKNADSEARRADTRICSNACRQKAFRVKRAAIRRAKQRPSKRPRAASTG